MTQRKGIIYARQSSGKENESESINLQIAQCRLLAQKSGIRIMAVEADANTSGRLYPEGAEDIAERDGAFQNWYETVHCEKLYRRGLGRVMAQLGKIDCIIVYDVTRLYRPVQFSFLQAYIDNAMVRNHVKLVTVTDGETNPSDFSDSLVTTIKSHVNDNQIRLTSEKSRMALMSLKDSGYVPNCPRMYGIRYVGGKDRAVEIVEEEAEVIRFVFGEVVKYKAYNSILREMNHCFSGRARGKEFYSSNVRHIVAQPFYCGYMYDSHGALIPARQMEGKAIISFETWRRAQEILGRKRRPAVRRKALFHPFTGLMRCGYCGSGLYVGIDRGKEIYHCVNGEARDMRECVGSRVVMTMGRPSPYSTGLKEALAPCLALALFKGLEDMTELGRRARNLDKISAEIAMMKTRLNEAANAFTAGNMPLAAYTLAAERLNAHIKAGQDEITLLKFATMIHEQNERKLRGALIHLGRIMHGNIADSVFEELLQGAIKHIDCFRDYITVETVFGAFRLDRIISGRRRLFPRFTYKTIFPNRSADGSSPSRLVVTYHYGPGHDRKLVADFGVMKIISGK